MKNITSIVENNLCYSCGACNGSCQIVDDFVINEK